MIVFIAMFIGGLYLSFWNYYWLTKLQVTPYSVTITDGF